MIPRILSSPSVIVAAITLLLLSSINAQHHHNRHIKKQNNRQRLTQSTTTSSLLCACSPQYYKFQLLLNNDCSSSTLSRTSSPGISNVNCQIDDKVDGGLMSSGFVRRRHRDLQKQEQSHSNSYNNAERSLRAEDYDDRYDILTSQVQSLLLPTIISKQARQSTTLESTTTVPSYISSILFIEFDTSGLLTLINTNDTYLTNQTLTNSTFISYPSISTTINTDIPLDEQLDKIPGGAGLFLFGNNNDGDVVLRSRLVWEYDFEDCSVELDVEGDTLGWIMFVSISILYCSLSVHVCCVCVECVLPIHGPSHTFASHTTLRLSYVYLYHIFDLKRRRSRLPSMSSVQHLRQMHRQSLQVVYLQRQVHLHQTLLQQVYPLSSQVQVL